MWSHRLRNSTARLVSWAASLDIGKAASCDGRLGRYASGHMSEAVGLEVRGVVVGLFRENCWIVGSRRRGEACVIDPGDEPDEILALARDMGVRITRVVASHAHLDHILAARAIVEATDAPFLLHQDDLFIADGLPASARMLLGQDVPPAPKPVPVRGRRPAAVQWRHTLSRVDRPHRPAWRRHGPDSAQYQPALV